MFIVEMNPIALFNFTLRVDFIYYKHTPGFVEINDINLLPDGLCYMSFVFDEEFDDYGDDFRSSIQFPTLKPERMYNHYLTELDKLIDKYGDDLVDANFTQAALKELSTLLWMVSRIQTIEYFLQKYNENCFLRLDVVKAYLPEHMQKYTIDFLDLAPIPFHQAFQRKAREFVEYNCSEWEQELYLFYY